MKKVLLFLRGREVKTLFFNDYLIGEIIVLFFIIFLSILLPVMGFSQSGKDGAESYTTSGTYILNRYTTLASSATAGSTSITVNSVADLSGSTSFSNSTNPYSTAALSAGDLVFIIKVQGADITTTDDANYGNITNYNGVGTYEFKTVLRVIGNQIQFCDGLQNEYTVGGRNRVQVIRVPRLTTLNISGGTDRIVSARPWDGTIGGICVIETSGNVTFANNAAINVNGLGFRAGTDPNRGSSSTVGVSNTIFRTTATGNDAGKGESIVGNAADYAGLNGANGRGAPANGGGGGNGHNAGGGGGSNAGSLTGWNGTGTKPTGFNAAWNLESASFATNVSPGGGRGGYTYGASNADALTQGPGNTAWAGDNRQNTGGFGGRPLDYNTNTRVFLGGGGGAGEGNDNVGGDGGNGGGLVFLLVGGNVSGAGIINANGNNGASTTGTGNDAPGGGGGGGAVVLLSLGTINTIVVNANGGNGGNQTIASSESEGPGGGGGGGYILTTTTAITRNANGGNGGTTNSSAVTEFPPNGATNGTAGTVANGTYFEPTSCFNEIVTDGCGPGFVRVNTNRVLNGDFSIAITNATGNSYTAGDNATAGTVFNFTGGTFRSQSDFAGGSTNHRFDIRTGNYTSGSINQNPFPGDATYAIPATNTWMHHNGNNLTGEALIWEQTLTGLTIGRTYTFYFYVSNVYNTSAGNDPSIQLRMDGTTGIPTNGTVVIPAISLDEVATSNAQPLSGWVRFSHSFTATATSHIFKITNTNTSTAENEVGLTAIGLSECVSICSAPTSRTITAANTIVNSYYAGAASVSAGATSIILGTKNSEMGVSENIQPGDLLLVIQMQGATINSTNTINYGSNTGTLNGFLTTVAGTYEYVYAASHIINNVVTLANPLRNSYTAAAASGTAGQYTFQVIRVPEYTSLTVNGGASLTAATWNGSTGGVMAVNVSGAISLGTGTSIDVSGRGFRGGGGRNTSGNGNFRDVATSLNSSKGEGIAGTPQFLFNGTSTITDTGIDGYPNGSSGSGAPGNAGGGNSAAGDGGAGGGSNFGAGGRGGRNWNTPTVDNGGYGGAALSSIINSNRLFLGGGGGAGSTNNGTGSLGHATSSGAAGGGIVLINAGSVSGTSTINANGNAALNPDNDGAGGGGAGGSVYFNASNTAGLANITITARGGKGGDSWPTIADAGSANDGNPEHGPGGGGGGGVIFANGTINGSSSAAGGANGITTTSNLPYFATSGASGLISVSSAAVNLALTGTATQSSNWAAGPAVASRAIDNNTDGDFNNGSVSHTLADVNPWWRVNLAATSTVQRIVVWNRTDCCSDRLNGAIVEILNTSNVVIWSGTIATPAPITSTFNTGNITNAAAVRITIPRTEFLQLAEVQVFGFASSPAFTTVSLPTKVSCDIDDDNDGLIDAIENVNGIADPFEDADNDGVLNMFDRVPGGTVASWVDANSDGINDNYDADLDGIINELDLDSDNDGIPDVIENYGVDANGDGVIDNFVDANGDGLSDNVSTCNNLLSNPSFETPVRAIIGNNLTGISTLGAWTNTLGTEINIIRANGTVQGGGPDNAQNSMQYLDVLGNAILEQTFTLATAATINFGGYFSSREPGGYLNWTGSVQILTAGGVVLATSSTRTFTSADGAEDQVWYHLFGNVALAAGNYRYRVNFGDYGNFDNAYVFPCSGGLFAEDFDGDGIPNYIDLDSDNDGIPDLVETGGADTNNDGRIDSFTDADENGYHDAYAGSPIIVTGADTNSDGRADSWPVRNVDRAGLPNAYDLDSDGDGITDLTEAGFAGSAGRASGTLGTDGWSDTIDALGSLGLRNTDSNGFPDYIDIDSDNDGITDNVEAQSTSGYILPTLTDSDNDGIADIYESAGQVGIYGGNGLTPFDRDGDSTPDYRDLDTDNDGAPDRNEGADRNQPTFRTMTQATIDGSGDTDGDGLMDVFDNLNITALSLTDLFRNVTMSNMGPGGNYAGPTPSGSSVGLQGSNLAADRDWRNAAILPLNITDFSVVYNKPVARLKWDVQNEYQTNFYEVEYSENGIDFDILTKQNANNSGNATYNHQHNLSSYLHNIIYYRIKQTDKDGRVYYSKIIPVRLQQLQVVTVAPNPVKSFINVSFNSTSSENATIQIMSIDGRVVLNKQVVTVNGLNTVQVTGLDNLQKGTYVLRLIQKSELTSVTIFKD